MTSGIQVVAQQVKQLRQERAWPQEQLAQICDVSVRTVQRVENGEACSYETLTALAAAFDLQPSDLTSQHNLANRQEITMIPSTTAIPISELVAGFKRHLFAYVAVNLLLIGINLSGNPDKLWFIYPLLGWGIGLVLHWFKIRAHSDLPSAD